MIGNVRGPRYRWGSLIHRTVSVSAALVGIAGAGCSGSVLIRPDDATFHPAQGRLARTAVLVDQGSRHSRNDGCFFRRNPITNAGSSFRREVPSAMWPKRRRRPPTFPRCRQWPDRSISSTFVSKDTTGGRADMGIASRTLSPQPAAPAYTLSARLGLPELGRRRTSARLRRRSVRPVAQGSAGDLTPAATTLLATSIGGLIILNIDYTTAYEDALRGVERARRVPLSRIVSVALIAPAVGLDHRSDIAKP